MESLRCLQKTAVRRDGKEGTGLVNVHNNNS